MTRDEVLAELYTLVAKPESAVQAQVQVQPSDGGANGADIISRSRVSDQLAVITQQLDLLKTVQQSQADLVGSNTKALAENTASRIGSTVADAAKGAASGLLSGFGLSPIVSGLLRLFGGGGSTPAVEAPVAKYAAPDALRLDAGLIGGRELAAVDYGAGDRVRAVNPPRAAVAAATQVTVQVHAMDSRSFLDHSDDIARAVRLAMLESHAINDVVAEL